jgi:hypothetical protein
MGFAEEKALDRIKAGQPFRVAIEAAKLEGALAPEGS